MKDKAQTIRIHGLTKLDELELGKQLSVENIRFESASDKDDIYGEIATITAVMIVSLAALRILALHLVRSSNRKSFKKRIEVEDGKGGRHVVEIEYMASSSEAPEADILKQLATACDVDTSELP